MVLWTNHRTAGYFFLPERDNGLFRTCTDDVRGIRCRSADCSNGGLNRPKRGPSVTWLSLRLFFFHQKMMTQRRFIRSLGRRWRRNFVGRRSSSRDPPPIGRWPRCTEWLSNEFSVSPACRYTDAAIFSSFTTWTTTSFLYVRRLLCRGDSFHFWTNPGGRVRLTLLPFAQLSTCSSSLISWYKKTVISPRRTNRKIGTCLAVFVAIDYFNLG